MNLLRMSHRHFARAARLKRVLIPCAVSAAITIAVVLGFTLGSLHSLTSQYLHSAIYCTPNGDLSPFWRLGDYYVLYWDPTLFFSITLGMGHLTFSGAKAIDVAWDLCAGRGGQGLLAWWAFGVLRRSLATSMEV